MILQFNISLYKINKTCYHILTLLNRVSIWLFWGEFVEKFNVYYDPDDLDCLCQYTPYNLKNDIKKIDKETLKEISEEIANELYYGLNRPPSIAILHWGKKRQAACAKIRVVDVKRDSGKSGGYRCIVLIDNINHCVFLLHIYRHAHGESENIKKKDFNKLNVIINKYKEALAAAANDN